MKQEEYMPLPPPAKLDIELEIDGFFHNGDKGQVARLVQRDLSVVSRMLSPNNDHNNHVVFTFLMFLWAFDSVRQDLGAEVINVVLRERQKWLGDTVPVEHPAKLTANVGHQCVEATEAEMLGLSIDEQIKEWTDVVNAATVKRNALIGIRSSAFRGQSVSTDTRDAVKAKMNGHKR